MNAIRKLATRAAALTALWIATAASAQDDCDDATGIQDAQTPFSTVGATTDGPPGCGNIGNDVWFHYVMPCHGAVDIHTCGNADFPTVLVLYDGCGCPPDPLSELACSAEGVDCAQGSFVSICAPEGQCFLIRVGGVNGQVGQGVLFVECIPDTEPPSFDGCPAAMTVSTDPGACDAVVSWPPPTADDDCFVAGLESNYSPGATFPLGTTLVSYTAIDGAGNAAHCVFSILVEDNEPPTVTSCPTDLMAEVVPGACSATVSWPPPTVTDNCLGALTIDSTDQPGDVFPLGPTPVVYTITDGQGNVATCSFLVEVTDTQPPQITCPSDMLLEQEGELCGATVTFEVPATDNCPGVTVVCDPPSGFFFPVDTTRVTCTATDVAGNVTACTFDVQIVDTSQPVIACPADIMVDNDPGECGAIVTFAPQVTENCPGVTVVCDPPSGSFFAVGTTTVTCAATDAANIEVSCSFSVTVNDVEPMVFVCPGPLEMGNSPLQCGAWVNYAVPVVTDNCEPVAIACDPPPGAYFPPGETVVHCTILSASGEEETCEFVVDVVDDEPPQVECPSTLTAFANSNCLASIHPLSFLDQGFEMSDNCDEDTDLTVTTSLGTLWIPPGQHFVTWTIFDSADNASQCSSFVTVLDLTAPTVDCDSVVLGTDPDECGVIPTIEALAVDWSDNCGVTTVSFEPDIDNLFPPGPTEVVVTVADAAGLSSQCPFTIIVVDDDPPFLDSPIDIAAVAAPGACGAVVSFDPPEAVDNCTADPTVVCTPPSGSFFPVATTTVTCVATDEVGNTTERTFTVTVADHEPPEIICPQSGALDAPAGECGLEVEWVVEATDNCADPVTIQCSPPSGSFFRVGRTQVECIATDGAENDATCTFDVIVRDPYCSTFTYQPLPSLPGGARAKGGGRFPSPVGMRIAVVGETRDEGGGRRAAAWILENEGEGAFIYSDPLPGGGDATANDIVVPLDSPPTQAVPVGSAVDGSGKRKPVLWINAGGAYAGQELPLPGGWDEGEARGIASGADGLVIGGAGITPEGDERPTMWIEEFPGSGTFSVRQLAEAIGAVNTIKRPVNPVPIECAGYFEDDGQQLRPMLWHVFVDGEIVTQLETLEGGQGEAKHIDPTITGWSTTGAGLTHAVLWAFDGLDWPVTDLGAAGGLGNSVGLGVYDFHAAGEPVDATVVGYSYDDPDQPLATLWRVREGGVTPVPLVDLIQGGAPPAALGEAAMTFAGSSGREIVVGTGTAAAPGGAVEEAYVLLPFCPADTDGNFVVDVADLVAVVLDWGCGAPGPCPGDVDGSGVVDVDDLVEVVLAWGSCFPGGAAATAAPPVPEGLADLIAR